MAKLIDEKTSKRLKLLLDKNDKRKVAIKHKKGTSYIDRIINMDGYNEEIVADLIKLANKKELIKTK